MFQNKKKPHWRKQMGIRVLPYLKVAVLQAATIIRLITTSTGTKSATLFTSQSIVLNKPFPQAAMRPVGPFQLSTHPDTGSFQDDKTIIKKRMF